MARPSRVPFQPRGELGPQQQELHDQFCDIVDSHAGPGASDGPSHTLLPIFLVLPQAGKLNMDLLAELSKTGLPADVRETIALVCASHFHAPYFVSAHVRIATKLGRFSQQQIDSMVAGNKPELDERTSLAFDVAHHMVAVRGPLPQQMWESCNKVFGKEGTAAVMHLWVPSLEVAQALLWPQDLANAEQTSVALYSWSNYALNMADVPAPSQH